jgi:amino-acid N-acetyltransferase
MTQPSQISLISIRLAVEADAPIIRKMINDAGLDTTSRNWRNFLIAEVEEQIVGIGQIKPYPDCQELGSLVVLPAYRHQRIAGKLIEALEAKAGRPLYLLCVSKMEGFYARFGYQRVPFRLAPRTLKLKLAASLFFRIIGIKVIAMRKE